MIAMKIVLYVKKIMIEHVLCADIYTYYYQRVEKNV